MAQIREIRKRIKSIGNTQKVTHAMELVSAAKMRKAQGAALSGRPYVTNLDEIITLIRQKSEEISHRLMQPKQAPKQLVILITSDRGLTGGLNINLFREILREEIKDAKFIAIGKKATNFAAKTGQELLASFESEEKPALALARIITKIAAETFLKNEVSKVSIVYPHFESTVKQTPTWLQILPVELGSDEIDQKIDESQTLLFEPSVDKILSDILPHFVLTRIYQILLEAKASEHSARMVAMKNATDAAGDLIDDLILTYNQARQEAITKELLDIVTAQKAFE